ncbi:MAG: ABC transporter permease [Chitinophagaceae bacterium]|nr:ABC transporter permease [Chitinophagaceae bacterium]
MFQILVKKLLYGILVLVGVVMVVFLTFQAFGDPARMVLGQSGDAKTIENIRRELYLDQPKWKQFVFYVNDISPVSIHTKAEIEQKQLRGFFLGGDTRLGLKIPYLRRSYQTKKEVTAVLMEALPGTVMLAVAAMLIAIMLGIPLGILAAVKKNTWMDTSAVVTSVIGISAPSFYMAIVIAYVFGLVLHQYTGLPLTGSWFDINETTGQRYITLQNMVLPAVTLGIRPLAIVTQLTRSSMLDVLNQDFIRTAYAKGLSKQRVVWGHALRNALNPVVTAVTGWFAELLAGSFFVEYIFGYKGIGKVTVDALENLDYPVVMGSVLLAATIFVLINILSDMLYAVIDPRVKVE